MPSVAELRSYFDSLASVIVQRGRRFDQELSAFYSALTPRLARVRQAQREDAAHLATRFNVFKFARPDENAISDLIADLLNPEGDHGQGSVFLREFLRLIGHPGAAESGAVRVRCQDPANWIPGGGIMDITLEIEDVGIGIENKPFAAEQQDQLLRYCSHLSKKYRGQFCMVFLGGKTPEPQSIGASERRRLEAEGRFKALTYQNEIKGWLQFCEVHSKAPKVRLFLGDLRNFLEAEIPPIPYAEES